MDCMSSPEVLHNARVSFEDSRIAVGAKGRVLWTHKTV